MDTNFSKSVLVKPEDVENLNSDKENRLMALLDELLAPYGLVSQKLSHEWAGGGWLELTIATDPKNPDRMELLKAFDKFVSKKPKA